MDKITSVELMDSKFPFQVDLSLERIVDFWKEQDSETSKPLHQFAETVLAEMDKLPQLRGVITDESLLTDHKNAVDLLLSAAFSVGTWGQDIRGVFSPFKSDCLYETPRFEEIAHFMADDAGDMPLEWLQEMEFFKVLYAYSFILERVYNRKIDISNGMIFKTVDAETKLSKYYGAVMNPKFVEVIAVGESPALSDEQFNELLNNFYDLDLWMEMLPPSKFRFEGVTIIDMVDITEQQIASVIKEDLLTNDALLSDEKFKLIQQSFRALICKKDMVLGIGSWNSLRNSIVNFGDKKMHFIIPLDQCESMNVEDRAFYEVVYKDQEHLVIPDIEKISATAPAIEKFKKNGVRSVLVIPLVLQHTLVGVLQFGSSKPNSLSTLDLLRVKDLLPVLALAVKRSTDDLQHEVIGVIKEKFTALHPAIEWKFQEVALDYLDKKKTDPASTIAPIVFSDIYPLYGSSDIRGSSVERNKATQADLVEQLTGIRVLFESILKKYPFPIYRELDFEVNNHLLRIQEEILSDDEVMISEMIHREIEPLFEHISKVDKDLRGPLAAYFETLDPEFKVLYKRRKEFADSVTMLNELVYSIIENEEEKTQEMFPYYFENYKTDGVEYNIYIGQSLVKNLQFNPIYLYNLRLWQLMVMCKVTRETMALSQTMPIPLRTAELILVHSAPLAIRFRTDEKKFDVDGAYNIRYEIMKKRIDKAVVKGSGERLTQPGTISVIYSSQKEEKEYLDYIKYLAHLNYIDPSPELFDLDYLQGVSGLKAMRLKVNLSDDDAIAASFQKELKEVLGPLS